MMRLISWELQQCLIPIYPRAGELEGNTNLHKRGLLLITSTTVLAEMAEHELNDLVWYAVLNSYMIV